ncbi:hypothetical protein AVEN_144292-1 [Araneus ventricosus]|uniref:Uncharacterized protein n=1 Tax=Araneus ventricosus TaxID=182803 RepID=A0A4Y2UW39_ARAVE|nr:hypothetical protein AVEN_272594-1 [Araneus ventricosus]GBO17242.1 hypothetical protein AVEN_144292-1 [Araneus ventricosus]
MKRQTFIECCIQLPVKTLEERSRKAKLCLQYFKEVSVMHYFVRAERTGDWNLHLYFVQRILVHLHAAGNIHYSKSAHLYLQNMSNLKTSLSDQEFERSVNQGYFTVRRSDKFWCGVWTDITIEQVKCDL